MTGRDETLGRDAALTDARQRAGRTANPKVGDRIRSPERHLHPHRATPLRTQCRCSGSPGQPLGRDCVRSCPFARPDQRPRGCRSCPVRRESRRSAQSWGSRRRSGRGPWCHRRLDRVGPAWHDHDEVERRRAAEPRVNDDAAAVGAADQGRRPVGVGGQIPVALARIGNRRRVGRRRPRAASLAACEGGTGGQHEDREAGDEHPSHGLHLVRREG